ncbi:MAG: M23 family metallopeptidase [Pseudomonadota bacterium]
MMHTRCRDGERLSKSKVWLAAGALLLLAVSCGRDMPEDGPSPSLGPVDDPAPVEPADPPSPSEPADPPAPPEPPVEPPVEPPAPPAAVFDHRPPGQLLLRNPGDLGTARNNGKIGVTDPSVVAPLMRFPIDRGPAFLNSQIFMYGGGGYNAGGGEVYTNTNVGQENDQRNFDYPWFDNFCEVRTRGNGLCAAGSGHHGQDIRPATCDNGAFMAVAPEDGFVRRIGSTHLVEIYGDSGVVYKYLHIDRPLPAGIVKNARVTRGQPIGKVSNKTGATSRSTTVHLHFEIWHGTADGFVNTGAGPLPPYTSLVESYLDLVDANPDQLAPVAPPTNVSACHAP